MMYPSPFPNEFYRALTDALHIEVRSAESTGAIRAAWQRVEHLRCACC